tara:strand:- start:1027 stop:1467 length:441 start_codon:yes stop_codon:yes gene_type:complete
MNSLHKLTLNINKIYNKNNINKDLLQLKTLINKYNGDDWTKYIKYSKNYDKKLIYNNNLYELFVISWMPQSQSYIHDHSNNGCLFKILNGNLTEYLYNKDIELIKKKNILKITLDILIIIIIIIKCLMKHLICLIHYIYIHHHYIK